jgi:hypothetical protein
VSGLGWAAMVGNEAGGSGTPGDVDAQVAAARDRADQAQAYAAAMRRITGRGTALSGGVTVEVDPAGAITGLGITDTAASHGGQSVRQAIRQAHAEAQQMVRQRSTDLTTATWGAGTATTQAVIAETTSRHRVHEPDDADRDAKRGGAW